MGDSFELTLNSPITDEDWDKIMDVEFENTKSITFRTKSGKTVEFAKVVKGKWLEREVHEKGQLEDIEEWQSAKCSVCGRYHTTPYLYYFTDYNHCPRCGAEMEDT